MGRGKYFCVFFPTFQLVHWLHEFFNHTKFASLSFVSRSLVFTSSYLLFGTSIPCLWDTTTFRRYTQWPLMRNNNFIKGNLFFNRYISLSPSSQVFCMNHIAFVLVVSWVLSKSFSPNRDLSNETTNSNLAMLLNSTTKMHSLLLHSKIQIKFTEIFLQHTKIIRVREKNVCPISRKLVNRLTFLVHLHVPLSLALAIHSQKWLSVVNSAIKPFFLIKKRDSPNKNLRDEKNLWGTIVEWCHKG